MFFDLRTDENTVLLALKLLLCKVELMSIRFVLGVSESSVLAWLQRAAAKAEEINAHLLREVKVTQVQLDEIWSFVERKVAQQRTADGESSDESSDCRQWVWVSFAPEYRLLLAAYVGPRTWQSALTVIQLTAAFETRFPSALERAMAGGGSA